MFPLEPLLMTSEERRVVTVLFADLAEFTALAESMDPEDLRAVVTRFYNLVASEVARFGGTVEKYVGDAALAIFGLPELHEDDAERAIRAALTAQQALTRLNDALARSAAERHLDEAARVLGNLPYLPARIELHLARARLLAVRQRMEDAWAALTAAEAALGQIAGQIHDPDLKDSFLSSWLAKRVGAARIALAETHSRR